MIRFQRRPESRIERIARLAATWRAADRAGSLSIAIIEVDARMRTMAPQLRAGLYHQVRDTAEGIAALMIVLAERIEDEARREGVRI